MTIPERIKATRTAAQLSPAQLASLIGVNRSTVVRYESGAIKTIPSDVLAKIAEVLGVSYDFLLGKEDGQGQKSPETLELEKTQRLLGKVLQKSTQLNSTGLVILSQKIDDLLLDRRFRSSPKNKR